MKTVTAAMIGLMLALPAQAQDAILSNMQGNVLIERGGQKLPASEGTNLFADDRLITGDESSAEVLYQNECRATLDPNSMMTVQNGDACTAGLVVGESGSTSYQSAAIGAGPIETGYHGPLIGGFEPGGLFVAGAFTASVVAAILDDDNDAISPE